MVKSESKTRNVGRPSECAIVRWGNRKGFATDKKRRYTFYPGGITEPSIKILARSIKVDDTDIVDGTRQ